MAPTLGTKLATKVISPMRNARSSCGSEKIGPMSSTHAYAHCGLKHHVAAHLPIYLCLHELVGSLQPILRTPLQQVNRGNGTLQRAPHSASLRDSSRMRRNGTDPGRGRSRHAVMKDAARAEGPEGPKRVASVCPTTPIPPPTPSPRGGGAAMATTARGQVYKSAVVSRSVRFARRRVGRRDDERLDGLAGGGHLDGLARLREDGLGGGHERGDGGPRGLGAGGLDGGDERRALGLGHGERELGLGDPGLLGGLDGAGQADAALADGHGGVGRLELLWRSSIFDEGTDLTAALFWSFCATPGAGQA